MKYPKYSILLFLLITIVSSSAVGKEIELIDGPPNMVGIKFYRGKSYGIVFVMEKGDPAIFRYPKTDEAYAFTPTILDKTKNKVRIKVSKILSGEDGKDQYKHLETVEVDSRKAVALTKTKSKMSLQIVSIGKNMKTENKSSCSVNL